MDRNSIIGFILIAAILIGYTWYTMPSAEQLAQEQRTRDSLAQVELERRALEAERSLAADREQPTLAPAIVDTTITDAVDQMIADSLRLAVKGQRFGLFAAAAEGPNEEVTIENERLQITFTTRGARPTIIRLKEYSTFHGAPLYLADPDSGTYGCASSWATWT